MAFAVLFVSICPRRQFLLVKNILCQLLAEDIESVLNRYQATVCLCGLHLLMSRSLLFLAFPFRFVPYGVLVGQLFVAALFVLQLR